MTIDLPRPWYRKAWFILLVIVILLVVSGGAAKLYLYVKFLLGNDIVVKLNADREVLSLQRGSEEELTFKASITTNPFCTAICTATFTDISGNKTIDAEQFTLRTGIPFKNTYLVRADRYGVGQDLYGFKMECRSTPTTLCHTTGDATTRALLITVNRELNELDQSNKEYAKERIMRLNDRLSLWNAMLETFKTVNIVKIPFPVQQIPVLQNRTKVLAAHVNTLQMPWDAQNYDVLLGTIDAVESEFLDVEAEVISLNNSINTAFTNYNSFITDLRNARTVLETLKTTVITTNKTLARELNETIIAFNQAATYYDVRTAYAVINKTYALNTSIREDYRRETLRRLLELDRESDARCLAANICAPHPFVSERANMTSFELGKVCGEITKLRNYYLDLNASIIDDVRAANYSDTKAFWDRITIKVRNLKEDINAEYRSQIPEQQPNTALLRELLVEKPRIPENGLEDDVSYAMLVELTRQRPSACEIRTIQTQTVNVIAENITAPKVTTSTTALFFDEPTPICCVHGSCRVCCTSTSCKNDPSTYPVIFLHGHAFYQDLSAEYSLDIFNKLQNRLEDDGYVNAGAITLYTEHDTPQGDWGISGAPFTIKASYYFDLFKEPNNYIIVQANSENIDTYAIRLKELIETVQYKTGKPKVIIVAHSMGGLVTRRYLQIFGEDKVDRLILIATPNKGVVGNILDYCPLVGEKLECRDMNADSLFMNKLNSGKKPSIPITNIIGTGCQMKQGLGDGVVLEENARLEGATNIIVNGGCKGIDTLHFFMLNIERYPEVYGIIKNALKMNST